MSPELMLNLDDRCSVVAYAAKRALEAAWGLPPNFITCSAEEDRDEIRISLILKTADASAPHVTIGLKPTESGH